MPPTPRFSVLPENGDIETQFIFDARKSSDDKDSGNKLQIRWDWNNDGIWDTEFSTELVQQHNYDSPGSYIVKLQVKDTGGLMSVLSRTIDVSDIGPLYPPVIISPEDGSINNILNKVLIWSCYHLDNLQITYDIYFGEKENPPLFKENYISTVINPGLLESGTDYYWKIVAMDETGAITSSPIFTFSTHLVDERDGKSYDIIKVGDMLWMGENLNFNTEKGSWCYSNDPEKCLEYGSLYNWQTAFNSCPHGWHLPSDGEWKLLEMNMLMTDSDNWGPRGDIQGEMIKVGGSSGFNAIMAGTRDDEGNYSIEGTDTGFWTSTGSVSSAFYRWIFYQQSYIYRYTLAGNYGLSVRCLKN